MYFVATINIRFHNAFMRLGVLALFLVLSGQVWSQDQTLKLMPYPQHVHIKVGEFTLPKKIALTFDDGPDPVYTPQVL
ncbi:MAG: hypothetical protein EOO68_37195, partial [Moraxellaceae bacterium]